MLKPLGTFAFPPLRPSEAAASFFFPTATLPLGDDVALAEAGAVEVVPAVDILHRVRVEG